MDEENEEDIFQPSKGNVAFGSAHDGWAFTLDQFAHMYAEKLGAKPEALCAALWGDYAYLPKEKRVVRAKSKKTGAAVGRLKPMFVQFALEPLWKAYSACEPGEDVQVGVVRSCVNRQCLDLIMKAAWPAGAPHAVNLLYLVWIHCTGCLLCSMRYLFLRYLCCQPLT